MAHPRGASIQGADVDEPVRDFPPDTYCYPGVFRPRPPEQLTPGLAEKIQLLMGAGRFRSALDVLFPLLDRKPDDQEALTLALGVIGRGRSQDLRAPEPLGPRYLYAPPLDPLFTVCTRCGNTWASARCLLDTYYAQNMGVMNAAGAQCWRCGYVLCRECFDRQHVGIDVSLVGSTCPACGENALRAPAYPTGRPPMQLPRRPVPVSAVVVFREGPVPPGAEYITALLEARSPEALNAGAEMIGLPLDPWPSDASRTTGHALDRLVESGRIRREALADADAGIFADERGVKAYLVQLYASRRGAAREVDARALLEARLGVLSETLRHKPAGLDRLLKGLVVEHMERVVGTFSTQANYALSAAVWIQLLERDILRRTSSMLEEAFRAALDGDRHQWVRHEGTNLLLIASAIPRPLASDARRYFPAGYWRFQEEQGMPAAAQTRTVAHWVLCCDGRDTSFHLTCLPVDTRATLVIATDLLTPAELRSIGFG